LSRQTAETQINKLKEKLAVNPADIKTREKLVRLYLIELDNPVKAAEYINESLDKTMSKYISGAAKPINEAPELACLELAKWYTGLSNQTRIPSSKAALLCRAKDYYERFLTLHQTQDLLRTSAILSLNKIEKLLATLGPAAQQIDRAGPWIDCLKLIELPKHIIQGKWRKQKNEVFVENESRSCLITIPLSPQGNYQIEVVFVRTEGKGQVGVHFPVGKTSCAVVLSAYNGWAHGLEKVRKASGDLQEGKWVHPGTLVNNQEYCLNINVVVKENEAEIKTNLDGKDLLQWQGPLSSLRPSYGWGVTNTKFLMLHAWNSAVQFKKVRIRQLKGPKKKLSEMMRELLLAENSGTL